MKLVYNKLDINNVLYKPPETSETWDRKEVGQKLNIVSWNVNRSLKEKVENVDFLNNII